MNKIFFVNEPMGKGKKAIVKDSDSNLVSNSVVKIKESLEEMKKLPNKIIKP